MSDEEEIESKAPSEEEFPEEAVIDEAVESIAVKVGELSELADGEPSEDAMGLKQLMDVPVRVTVELGQTRISLGELVKIGPGSLVRLDREAHEPADILVNGKIVARGEIVTINDSYGVRVTSVVQ
ncbi:MAG: flagellar motor switch protein FliN [Planctomycetota bacterium]|nr:flagellar motor switch protein FliN [Planctomycetota bacterium]